MNYTAIIVTYNRLELLKECLSCVEEQTLKFDSIVLVNNCSTDGTNEFLNDYCQRNKSIHLINSTSNLGGAGGFALGVKNVPENADYVLFIDDDAMLEKDFLQRIDESMEENISAYSGTISTENVIDTSHRRRLKNRVLMTKVDVPIDEYDQDSFYYDLATFCGLLVNKKVIDLIGLPKADYFIWYDDTEYCMRISQYSKIKNVNSARINHKTRLAKDAAINWKSYYGYRNQIDVGKRFSTSPFLYLSYRYAYHIFRIVQYTLLSIFSLKKGNYKKYVKLHLDVLIDSHNNTLGINRKYYPGSI